MKKLIYFTISNNIEYLNILKICIKSLNKFDYDGDILLITNFEKAIRDNIEFKNDIHFLNIEGLDILTSSSNKLKIYKFEKRDKYDKFIYCDLDTIWIKPPNILFDSIQENKIYMSTEYHQRLLMSHEYWGGILLSKEETDYINNNNIIGLNAGFFAFNRNMLETIRKIDDFFLENLDKASTCLEQPYINTFLFRNNLYRSTIDTYITNNANFMSEPEFDIFKNNGGVLLHFSAGIGNVDFKYKNMIKYID
jgi:hypothetical protein